MTATDLKQNSNKSPEFSGLFSSMDILKRYIERQNGQFAVCMDQKTKRASLFVVIPCYNEPDILTTLNSLADCYAPQAVVSVIVVINDSEDSPADAVSRNEATSECIAQWQLQHKDLFFDVQRVIARALPRKWAGVGWARKIGIDHAVQQIVNNNYADGIIVSFDADSTVLPNYLQAIESAFSENRSSNFFTIHFEHPYGGNALSHEIREGIIRYELHMRYYRMAMEWCGYPHAIHTVGSSFALRASAYVRQGGMNRRKAGEDFYFLHKLVQLGTYGNISSTTVFPSARLSDRVPFGTGAAIKKWSEGGSELNFTYALEAFGYLKPLFAQVSTFWHMDPSSLMSAFGKLHDSLQAYCAETNTAELILGLSANCATVNVFEKRFFHVINAFWILKYLNFVHSSAIKRVNLGTEPVKLLQTIGIQVQEDKPLENILEIFRKLDRRIGNCSLTLPLKY